MPEKYQQEIEEILKNAGESAPIGPAAQREQPPDDPVGIQERSRPSPARGRGPVVRLPRIALSPRLLLLSGLAIFIIGALAQPGFFVWLGLALIGLVYLLDFRLPRSKRIDPRWRGRPAGPAGPSAWDRIKRRRNG